MTRSPATTILKLVILLTMVLWAEGAFARQNYVDSWNEIYNPGGQTDPALGSQMINNVNADTGKVCQACHEKTNGGNPWNGYGWDVRVWFMGTGTTTDGLTTNPVLGDVYPVGTPDGVVDLRDAFVQVETMNSDKDPFGGTNIFEITSHSLAGWTAQVVSAATDDPNLTYAKDGVTINEQVLEPSGPNIILDVAPPAPEISVTPAGTLDFGVVTVGFSGTLTRTVTNTGTSDLTVGNVQLTGAPLSAEYGFNPALPSFPLVLAPSATQDVTVEYTPTDATTDAASLVIDHDALSTASPITIAVTATGQAAAANCNIDVAPLTLNFGNVLKNTTGSLNTVIDNTGTDPCTVNDLILGGGSFDFALGAAAPLLPFTVPAGGAGPVTVPVDYTPSDVGADSDTLTVNSNDGATPNVVVSLTGTGDPLGPEIGINPTALNFGAVTETFTNTLAVSVTNNGDDVLNVTPGLGGSLDFTFNNPAQGAFTVGVGASVDVAVDYTPAGVGDDAGTLSLAHDGINTTSPITVSLAGSGVAQVLCDIDVRPLTVDLGIIDVGTTAPGAVAITNTGPADCVITGITVNNTEFVITSAPAASSTVAPGATADVLFDYAPTLVGETITTLDVASSDVDEPTVSVTLIAEAGAVGTACDISSSALSLDFGSVTAGATATQSTTLSNIGDRTCGLTAKLATGTSYEFQLPPASFKLAPLGTQPVQVDYTPTGAGTDNSFLNVFSNDPDTPILSLPVTGTGLAAGGDIAFTPGTMDFGPVVVGATASDFVYIKNLGDLPLTVSGFGFAAGTSAEYQVGPGAPPLPITLQVGESSLLPVDYAPTDLTLDAGALEIASDDADTPVASVALTGSGVQFGCDIAVTPLPTLDFGSVVQGLTSSLPLTIDNAGDSTCWVTSLSLSGAEYAFGFKPVVPFTVEPGQPRSVTVEYTPATQAIHPGTLTIGNDDPDENPVAVGLTGTGIANLDVCNIAVTPTSIDFGAVLNKSSVTQIVTLENTGAATCNTVRVRKAAGGSAEFFVQTLNFSLASLATQTVEVTYSPKNLGSDFSVFNVFSDDPNQDQISVSLTATGSAVGPDIHVLPVSVDWGTVVEGGTYRFDLIIGNLGDANLDVTGLTIDTVPTTEFALAPDAPVPTITLFPGEKTIVPINYSPVNVGVDGTTLTVASSDADKPSIVVPLSGDAISLACDIVATPGSLDFGTTVEQFTTVNQAVTIANAGNVDCTVTSLAMASGSSADFAVNPVAPPNIVIAPGATVHATVGYTPSDVGADSGSVEIVSNDPGPTELVSLSGAGVAPPPACRIEIGRAHV